MACAASPILAYGVFLELGFEVWHQRRDVGEIGIHERTLPGPRIEFPEPPDHPVVAFERKEKVGREPAVRAGESHHHVATARPDMQRVGVHDRLLHVVGGDGQDLVAGIQHFDVCLQIAGFLHFMPDPRCRAVGPDQHLETMAQPAAVVTGLEDRGLLLPVDFFQLVVEVNADALGFVGLVQKAQLQAFTPDAVQRFVFTVAVWLQREPPAAVVNHASAHGCRQAFDLPQESGLVEGMACPLAERQVAEQLDRALAAVRVRVLLEQVDFVTAACQQDGQHGAGHSGADDRDIFRIIRHSCFQAPKRMVGMTCG